MLLLLAFVALTVGCVVLWLELSEYGEAPWWKTDGVPAVTSQRVPMAFPTAARVRQGWHAPVRLAAGECPPRWFEG